MGKVMISGVAPQMTIPLKNFSDCSWSEIQAIVQSGNASKVWNIGDTKAVHISGSFGDASWDETYYATIIGFDHNSAVEDGGAHTITMQCFNLNADTQKNIALVSSYNLTTNQSNGFTMRTTSSNSNSGGWSSGRMRETICPAFKASLPSDLQSVIKTTTLYTDNTGTTTDSSSYVTATNDSIFLLSEFEVLGERQYANSSEQTKQSQYEYYKSGNSTKKYRHDNVLTSINWWTRSPSKSDSTHFCEITNGENSYGLISTRSLGFVPCFKIG